MNWTFFTEKEMQCSYSGTCHMNETFMLRLITLRSIYNKPMIISSAYRCPDMHPIELKKGHKNGSHALGRAVDVVCYGNEALTILHLAIKEGFTGFGVSQAGQRSQRFLHLDDLDDTEAPRPWIWSY